VRCKIEELMMKKSIVFGALLLLAGCGPSPEDVCKKTFDLMKAEVGEAAANKAIGGDMARCVKSEELTKDVKGPVKYKSSNQCVMDAKTLKEAQACSSKK
jgi:hypothetical protein